jgi:histidine triad (HIT) family protein
VTDCAYCKVAKDSSRAIYEDDLCYAMLVSKPANPGHVVLLPKEHAPILEAVPKKTLAHLWVVANKLSVSLFDGLQAQGSNVVVHNGVVAGQSHAHALMHILPRTQGDGLDFQWAPKQVSPEQLTAIANQLSQEIPVVGTTSAAPEESNSTDDVDSGEDYLTRAVSRLP